MQQQARSGVSIRIESKPEEQALETRDEHVSYLLHLLTRQGHIEAHGPATEHTISVSSGCLECMVQACCPVSNSLSSLASALGEIRSVIPAPSMTLAVRSRCEHFGRGAEAA